MKGRGGAVEWSVGKLMSIVLLIVVLALVVYGVSSGALIPLYERTGGMFDEVILFFSNWGVGGGDVEVECLTPVEINIEGVGDGILTKCRGYCEVEMDIEEDLEGSDFKSKCFKYNRKDGVMEDMKEDGEWYWFEQDFLGIDVEKAENCIKIYFELEKKLNDIFGDNEELKSVLGFNSGDVLEFKVNLGGYDIFYYRDVENKEWDWHSGSILDENFVSIMSDYYFVQERSIFWGYKKDGANNKIEGGLTILSFPKFIKDKVNKWDEDYYKYKEGLEMIEGSGIFVGEKEYSLQISSLPIDGVEGATVQRIPFVFVNLGDDEVGVYFNEKLYFHSKEENKRFEYIVSSSEGVGGDMIKVNKIYGVLKERCR